MLRGSVSVRLNAAAPCSVPPCHFPWPALAGACLPCRRHFRRDFPLCSSRGRHAALCERMRQVVRTHALEQSQRTESARNGGRRDRSCLSRVYLACCSAWRNLGMRSSSSTCSTAPAATARIGSTEGTTTANVVARVKQTVGTAVPASKITVYVKDAGGVRLLGDAASDRFGARGPGRLRGLEPGPPRRCSWCGRRCATTTSAWCRFRF